MLGDTSKLKEHVCQNFCIAFSVANSIEIGLEIKIFTISIYSANFFSIPVAFSIPDPFNPNPFSLDGYISDAGFGLIRECPNNAYRLIISAMDSNKNPLSGVEISVNGDSDTVCKTNSDGKAVYIPASVSVINEYAFNGCTNLETVYYNGTDNEWNKINIKNYNDPLLNAKRQVFYIPDKISYGDINSDGSVDLTDLTLLSLYLLKDRTFDQKQMNSADIDGNGDVDIADLARFKQYVCHDMAVPYIYKKDKRYFA